MHQSSISNPSPVLHTCSVSFVSVTAFPSMSVGDMVTAPLAVASSETSSCPSPISTSGTSLASTLFLLEEREEEDPVILETATLGDWLGDSFSLKEDHQLPVSELCNTPRHRGCSVTTLAQSNFNCGTGFHLAITWYVKTPSVNY